MEQALPTRMEQVQKVTVSFVIPCYKLAHLLSQCVESILSQTYGDFEILIMDDCSPDETPAVAASFQDLRIRYIRNEENLRQLQNYNKGINASRGKYIWLISADDYLRSNYVLERYVELMETNARIGFTFCPVVGVRDGKETGTWAFSVYSKKNQVVSGHYFLKRLLQSNLVAAPSCLVRRECYEKISTFPIDAMWAGTRVAMEWMGDWYLWCVFALSFDVAYFSEPMVCYREHDLSMTNVLTQQGSAESCIAGEIAMLWLVRERAISLRLEEPSRNSMRAVAHAYAQYCTSKQYQWLDRSSTSTMSVEQFEKSLCQSTQNEAERRWIRSLCFVSMGDILRSRGDLQSARKYYRESLLNNFWSTTVYVKLLLLLLGKPGAHAHKIVRSLRNVGSSLFFQNR
jgi:glycosyltransferase involved in cell wall biosynthesis